MKAMIMKMLTPAIFLRGMTPGKTSAAPRCRWTVELPATSRINFFETPATPAEPEALPNDADWVARVNPGELLYSADTSTAVMAMPKSPISARKPRSPARSA